MKKTLKRENRLCLAKDWIETYSGKNIVKGYSKKFSVDKLCAIKELRMNGFEISEEYENLIQKSLEAHKQQSISLKSKREDELNTFCGYENDEYFALILGYTSGGFPYGVTHEENKLYIKKI